MYGRRIYPGGEPSDWFEELSEWEEIKSIPDIETLEEFLVDKNCPECKVELEVEVEFPHHVTKQCLKCQKEWEWES